MLVWPPCCHPVLIETVFAEWPQDAKRALTSHQPRPHPPSPHQQADYLERCLWNQSQTEARLSEEFMNILSSSAVLLYFSVFLRRSRPCANDSHRKCIGPARKCLFLCPRLRRQPWDVLSRQKKICSKLLFELLKRYANATSTSVPSSFVWSGISSQLFLNEREWASENGCRQPQQQASLLCHAALVLRTAPFLSFPIRWQHRLF